MDRIRKLNRTGAGRGVAGWVPLVIVLVVLGVAAGGVYYMFGRRRQVATVVVGRSAVVRAFYATGVVRPDYEYVLKSKAQGALQNFDKREGAAVYKDEVIARVDDKQLKFEVEKCAAELAEAQKQARPDAPQRQEVQARLSEAKMQTQIAQENLDRTQASFDKKAANFTDLDAARRGHVQWVNTVAALESQIGTWEIASQRALDVAAANHRKALSNLADASVVSPINGVILERYVENQEVVGINQKLVLIAAPEDKLMKAAVDEEDITRTFEGQKVEMQLYAFQNRDRVGEPILLEGRVSKILPSANPASKTYEVKVVFSGAAGTQTAGSRPAGDGAPDLSRLRVGMTGELNFIEEESGKDKIVVPSSAVLDKKVYRPRGGGPAGWGGGGYEAVPVKTGVRTLEKVEILEGVKEGDIIVQDAKQAAPVKLPPPKQPVVPTRTGDEEGK